MSELTAIATLKDVKSAVLGDLSGGFHDAIRERDGEAVAAVTGLVASTFARAGEALGLGALRRVSVGSEARGCLILVRGNAVISARVEPGRSLGPIEKLLDASLQGGS